jgi:hypothetical protein
MGRGWPVLAAAEAAGSCWCGMPRAGSATLHYLSGGEVMQVIAPLRGMQALSMQ